LYFIGFSRQLQKRLPDDFNEFSAKQTPTKFFVFQTSGQKMEGFKGRPRRSRFATLRGKKLLPASQRVFLPAACGGQLVSLGFAFWICGLNSAELL